MSTRTERIQKADALFHAVWNRSADGMRLVDATGVVLFVNDAYCQLVELAREALEGQLFAVVYAAEDQLHILETLRRRFREQTIPSYHEVELTLWNGRRLWLGVSNSLVEGTEQPLLLSIFRNITVAKQIERALRESEDRYREILENASDAVYTVDFAGRITSVNRAAEQVSQYSREELLAMNVSQLIAPEHLEFSHGQLVRKLEGGGRTTYELELIKKDGQRLWMEVSSQLLLRDGKPVGILGIAREVSERRRSEEQLRESQKMEAVSQLAGGIAHDFNNLLTVITGYAELLLGGLGAGHPSRAPLQEIKKAGDRAAALTQQLLAFSRRQVLSLSILNLNDVVIEMTEMLRRLVDTPIDLQFALAPDLYAVTADRVQMEQALINLVRNARDAMPRGGQVMIETANALFGPNDPLPHNDLPRGEYAVLSVRDTGCGMSEETRLHLFEPFFTTKDVGQGIGMGLAMVYGAVRQSGGHISVESILGVGSTFRIYLPRSTSVDPNDPGSAPPRELPREHETIPISLTDTTTAPSVGGLPRGNETILLVDDEEPVRTLERSLLMQQGYYVLEARDGAEALDIATRHTGPIDILVTRGTMPIMTGRQLAERLLNQRPNLRIVFVSGSFGAAREQPPPPGAAFLRKPFPPGHLVRKVRDVLDAPA